MPFERGAWLRVADSAPATVLRGLVGVVRGRALNTRDAGGSEGDGPVYIVLFPSLPYPQYVREAWARAVPAADVPADLQAWARMPLLPGAIGRYEPPPPTQAAATAAAARAGAATKPAAPPRPLVDRAARTPGRGHSLLVWLRHHGANGAAGG